MVLKFDGQIMRGWCYDNRQKRHLDAARAHDTGLSGSDHSDIAVIRYSNHMRRPFLTTVQCGTPPVPPAVLSVLGTVPSDRILCREHTHSDPGTLNFSEQGDPCPETVKLHRSLLHLSCSGHSYPHQAGGK